MLFLAEVGTTQQYQTNWEPNRYKVKCTHGNCLTNLWSSIEKNLEEIVAKYKADGWRAHKRFGPVEGTGPAAHRVVTDVAAADRYFQTVFDPTCTSAHVEFGQATETIAKRPYWLYYFNAHEIFHVTQRTYPAFNTCAEKRYGWIGESLSTAVGLYYVRKRFPTKFPITDTTHGTDKAKNVLLDKNLTEYEQEFTVMEREILSDAGGREYHVPLNWQDFQEDGKENNSAHVRYYRTSGLWRHIAEVYPDRGDYKFVQTYLDKDAANDDWLNWVHENVYNDLKIKSPLARVFALYMADVANWYRPGRPAMHFEKDETRWHKILYDGCLEHELSPSNPKAMILLDMWRSSARCVKITAKGLGQGERKAINVGAFLPSVFDSNDNIDALQLSLASSTDSKNLDCSEALRDPNTKLHARDKCVFGFDTGKIKISGAKNEGRIWNVVPQETKGGTSFTNTYILTRLAAKPTDDPPFLDGGEKMTVSVVFVLDEAKAAINSKTLGDDRTIGWFNGSAANFLPAAFARDDPAAAIFGQKLKTVRVVGHLNGSPANYSQETVPRYGKDGKQAIATRTPGAVTPSVPVLDLFGANPLLSSSGEPANTSGIWMLRWTAVEVEEDGLYQQTLKEAGMDYIAAMTLDSNGKDPRPLQIGDKGEFKAMVTARVGFKTLYTRTPATLKVDEYSLYVLRARIEGTLCEAQLESRRRSDECVNPQPVSATMVKAFAGLHDPNSRFIIEDTPATQQYARARQALMNEALDQSATDTPMPPEIEAGPSGEGAVVIQGCTCSCDDFPYLKKLQERVKKGEKLSGGATSTLRRLMGCMATCTPHYQTCKLKPR